MKSFAKNDRSLGYRTRVRDTAPRVRSGALGSCKLVPDSSPWLVRRAGSLVSSDLLEDGPTTGSVANGPVQNEASHQRYARPMSESWLSGPKAWDRHRDQGPRLALDTWEHLRCGLALSTAGSGTSRFRDAS